jgi:uncharacterized membrane protein
MKALYFKDPGFKTSATRIVFIIWCMAVLVGWLCVSWQAKELKPIPQSVVTFLGLLSGVKAAQRFTEGKTDPQKTIELAKKKKTLTQWFSELHKPKNEAQRQEDRENVPKVGKAETSVTNNVT